MFESVVGFLFWFRFVLFCFLLMEETQASKGLTKLLVPGYYEDC